MENSKYICHPQGVQGQEVYWRHQICYTMTMRPDALPFFSEKT